jgi:PAS domain S-box-containing protein
MEVIMATHQERDSSICDEIDALRRRIAVLEAEAVEHDRTRLLLLEQHSFREGVIERAAEGICVCHAVPEYPFVQFTVWNRRIKDITGYTMDEINRFGWYQSIYPDLEVQERARQRMSQMREGDDLQYERWEITRADGQKRTLGISTSLLKTADGLTHVLGLMQDVTEEERYRMQLEHKVVKLEGLLPICSSCKKIRDRNGVWHQLEAYITNHSEAKFTHGACPNCLESLYPDFKKK